MTDDTRSRFREGVAGFFMIALFNIAFGAIAMVFGMQFIVPSVQGLQVWEVSEEFR